MGLYCLHVRAVSYISTFDTYQTGTVRTESRLKIRSFMKFMFETTSKCMTVGMNKIFFHFFLTYHAITENEKMSLCRLV